MAQLYKQIGEKIRELRLRHEAGPMSQDSLASHLNVTPNTISRWETGTYKPSAEDLDALSRFFGVSITMFFPSTQNIDQEAIAILTSATSGLNKNDFDEVVRYAEFRKARSALSKTTRSKK